MHAGQYISGAAHLGLIGWLLLGGLFSAKPKPAEITEVSVISGSDFDAMIAAQQSPEQTTQVVQPEAPTATQNAPEVSTEPDRTITQPTPLQAELPDVDPAPNVTELALPPETQVDETAPVLEEPVGDVAVLVPEVAPQSVPRQVDRVAPEPVAQPEPDTPLDLSNQEAIAPDASQTPVERDRQDATAREEATTQIVTEATTAPTSSSRPPGRRPQVAPVPQAAQNEAPAEDVDAAAIAAAVAAAQASAQTTPQVAPSGPPLSAGEKEGLRVAVSNCWNVDVGGRSADTVVSIAVSLDREGRVVPGTLRMIGSDGGNAASVKIAFEAARRAILRCQNDGYKLPADKFAQWQNIEMTFNPERMRVK